MELIGSLRTRLASAAGNRDGALWQMDLFFAPAADAVFQSGRY